MQHQNIFALVAKFSANIENEFFLSEQYRSINMLKLRQASRRKES